jgi:hypothetical protein
MGRWAFFVFLFELRLIRMSKSKQRVGHDDENEVIGSLPAVGVNAKIGRQVECARGKSGD